MEEDQCFVHFDRFEFIFPHCNTFDTVGFLILPQFMYIRMLNNTVFWFCVARTNGINLNCATADVWAALFSLGDSSLPCPICTVAHLQKKSGKKIRHRRDTIEINWTTHQEVLLLYLSPDTNCCKCSVFLLVFLEHQGGREQGHV